LLLRAHAGEESQELAEWWTRFQAVDPAERQAMIDALAPSERPEGKRRRRRRRTRPADHVPQQ
jgi:poly(A) polymerase